MKKNKLIAFLTSIMVTIVASFSVTLAWFDITIKFGDVDADVQGSSAGAYFDSGTGTSFDDAYGIRTPRHLYNLAWLQYLGWFNKIENNKRQQFYFKLVDDIDMTGWTLPPIGTANNPFIGQFNGQGFTISNLNVSNYFDDYGKTPDVVNSVTGVDIIGLFGVVGSLNSQVTDENAQAVPMIDAAGSATYNSKINEIMNLGIDNITVSTQTSTSLIGLAAGYVNGNIDGIAVANSNINIASSSVSPLGASRGYTDNLSDYSLVGFATDAFKTTVENISESVETPDVQFNAADSAGDKWGGSISMKMMYDRLLTNKGNATTYSYVTQKSVYDVDNSVISSTTNNLTGNNPYGHTYKKGSEKDSENDQISSYTFVDRNDTNQFLYLGGSKKYNTSVTHFDDVSTLRYGDTFYLKKGNNFLVLGNYVSSTTNISNATLLYIDSNRRISNQNGTKYYLYVNGTNLASTRTASSGTQWTIESNAITVTQNNIKSALTYDNGWKLKDLNTVSMRIHNGSNYLRINNGALANGTQEQSTEFHTDSNGLYYLNGTTKMYLGFTATRRGSNPNYYYDTLNFTISNSPTLYFTVNDNRIQCRYHSYYYYGYGFIDSTQYLYYYNNTWQTGTTNRTVTVSSEQIPIDNISNYPLTYVEQKSTNTETGLTTDPTYFPLSYDPESTNDVYELNTGYVASGANFSDSDSMPGDIRVSYYGISSLSTSQISSGTKSELDIVTRTKSSGGYRLIKDDFNKNTSTRPDSDFSDEGINTTRTMYTDNSLKLEKYEKSRSYFNQILTEDNPNNRIYGLHFMDAQINVNRTFRIPKAVINEMTYDSTNTQGGYELPEDCIDFNLKSKGFINFFAGTYFGGNSTFFSLHEITRDNKYDISNIKEIAKIYANDSDSISARQNKPYIYEYSDGTNNVSGNDVKGTLEFDMNWVTNPIMVNNAVYYFEIPVNKGEYALGSVSGKNGAYLMYLDIGASANSTDVTIIRETIIKNTDVFVFPVGIDFVEEANIGDKDFTKIVGGETAAIFIKNGNGENTAHGIINFSYTENDNILSKLECGPPTGKSFTGDVGAVFISTYSESYYAANKMDAVTVSSETIKTKRKTEYYYNTDTQEVSYEVFERTEDGEGTLIQDYISVETGSLGEQSDFYTSEVQLRVDDEDAITLIKYRYDKIEGNTVTVKPSYNPETFEYSFNITCTKDTKFYIEELVSTVTIDNVAVTFSYKFNNTTVTKGNIYTITAS